MAALAQVLHARTIIFPETAALALGVWVLRDPGWLRRPWHLVVLPTGCAAMGVFVNHGAFPTMVRELLILWVVLVLLTVMRSSLSPAISAGLLPIVLNIHAWLFVCSVFLATGIIWVSGRRREKTPTTTVALSFPSWWTYAGFALVGTLWIGAAGFFGVRDGVLPPLLVFLSGTMTAPPKGWGAVSRDTAVLMVAALTSSAALVVLQDPIAVAALALAATTAAMRALNTWIPPAGAVALLPLVLPMSPAIKFPIIVAILSVGIAIVGFVSHRVRGIVQA